jgi:hypothetical protein
VAHFSALIAVHFNRIKASSDTFLQLENFKKPFAVIRTFFGQLQSMQKLYAR